MTSQKLWISALAIAAASLIGGQTSAQRSLSGTLGAVQQVNAKPGLKTRFDGTRGTFVPKWQTDMQVSSRENMQEMFSAPFFDGGSLDEQVVNLAYYDVLVPIGAQEEVRITSVTPEGVKDESSDKFRKSFAQSGLSLKSDWYPASNVITGPVEIRRGQHFQHVYVYPIQVNATGDRIRKADVVNYSVQKVRSAQRRATSSSGLRTYASNSVLANGDWYKMGVTSSGVYKIDYSYIQGLGVNPSSINPRTFKVHGNGGGMLPQQAGQFPHDDLVENPIWVSGQGDGSFDPGDFILFYASSPDQWKYVESLDRFTHHHNIYSDTAFYFLTWGGANGERIPSVASETGITQTPTNTRRYMYYENDVFNPLSSGRVWLGETFDLTTSQTFDFSAPGVASGTDATVTARVAARSNSPSNFTLRENGNTYATINITNTNTQIYGSYYYRANYATVNIPASNINDGAINVELVYSKPLTSSIGYLDYLEVEYRQNLNLSGASTWHFNAVDGVGPGEVFQYNIGGANSGVRVWDVTDPTNAREQSVSVSGATLSFGVRADSVKQFVAFTTSGHKLPVSVRKIPNQNLHGLAQADYLMITHPNFTSSATRLANFHREFFQRTVHVVNVQRIFNEFSSGAQDPTAIRDFIKMFYDRGMNGNGVMPRYVLLMGDGSYDYKGRVAPSATSNYVLTYQSRKSQRPTESYVSDDFFGFLDDGEGYWGEKAGLEGGVTDILYWAEGDTAINTHGLDVAIGRMPVKNVADADILVDKVINYISNPDGYGAWRNRVVLVADHKDSDGVIHISQADSYTPDIDRSNSCINVDKIYMDNYLMENTASGGRFPDGKDALLKSLDEGSLLVNYTGHGGEIGWSNASILDISDINNLRNGNRLPAYITATCEFGRWDDPGRTSGAEVLFLKEEGGSIAMFTTVRVVYSGPNYVLNQNFYDYVLSRDTVENRWPTMGEVFQKTKNASWLGGINNRNFSLMGDPGMPLAYPTLNAAVTKINGVPISTIDTIPDTLGALSLVTIEGEIRDDAGTLQSNFSGDMQISVFDKPSKFITKRAPFPFKWQKNRVFNGQATVTNGIFTFQFVVPIDISYEDGLGKISLYVNNNANDGAGCNDNIFIGGSSGASIVDNEAPEMELFMNDEHFADGGLVGRSPLMIADVYDENGLNTVGTGIGHELTAILDGNENDVIVLNDFYKADINMYQEGRIEYPFKDLTDGEHTLEVKVWDVANNSAKRTISFVVADDANMALGHVLNYPNPFSTRTNFYIEHNRNGHLLNVSVRVYTTSGRLVKSLDDTFFAEGNLYSSLEWDGLDEYGDAIGRGVYVYQVTVRDEESGERVNTFEKLVLLR